VRVTVEDDEGAESDSDITIDVQPEDALVRFHGGNPVGVPVETKDGSGPFELQATIREALLPDTGLEPNGEPGAYAGNIGRAQAMMTLEPVGPGGPVSPESCSSEVQGSGYDARLIVTCSFDEVPVNTYSAAVSVGGDYDAEAEDVLVVYDPNSKYKEGYGWFRWPGTNERTTFGFTMETNKKGSNVKGSLFLVRHVADGGTYRVKSNALYGLAVVDKTASFSGKSTYQEPSWSEPVGNYEFVVYVEDNGEPGTGRDRFWIDVSDDSDHLSLGPDAQDSWVLLDGGNIVVPHTPN